MVQKPGKYWCNLMDKEKYCLEKVSSKLPWSKYYGS